MPFITGPARLVDENNDDVNDNDFPIPNVHEGWGRVNLDGATDGTIAFVDEAATGLSTGGSQAFNVTTTGGPLKVTVVWSDYPSTDTATINLVNDLDLTVSGPSGTCLGNVFSGGWSATDGSADRRNNVENVYIQSPVAGTYTVTINAFNIPNGPQKFALVVDGGTIGAGPTPTPTNTPPPTNNTGFLSPSAQSPVTSSAGDNNGYESSPTNAFLNDTSVATDTNSGTGTQTSCTHSRKDKHLFFNYDFSIPSGSVLGIEVRLDARADSTSGAPKICVQLSWNGGSSWTTAKQTPTLGTSEATHILGDAADTWVARGRWLNSATRTSASA